MSQRERESGMAGTTAPAEELVRMALRAAVRAPSPHNTQPWRFSANGDTIDVLLDRSRVLEVCDPGAHEAMLACGAALLNLRLALAAAGQACTVTLLPDRAHPELLGTVRVGGPPHRPSRSELRLAEAIERRHTNRRPFLDRPVPLAVRDALTTAAADEGARLALLTEPHRLDVLAGLLRHADLLQTEDAAFRAELAAWTRGGDRDDGVPRSAGGPRPLDGALLALRDYGGGEARPGRRFERAALVGVLTTAGDTRLDLLRAGQAMQRVLLAATEAGLSASFLSQPVEVVSTRGRLGDLLGGRGYPQTVLRFGYGFPGAVTPRRPIDDVIMQEEAP